MLKDRGTSPSREMGKLVVIIHCPFSRVLLHYGLWNNLSRSTLGKGFFPSTIFFFFLNGFMRGKMTAEYQRQTEWTTHMLKDVLHTKSHISLGIRRCYTPKTQQNETIQYLMYLICASLLLQCVDSIAM